MTTAISKRRKALTNKVDRAKAYPALDAMKLVKETATAKFDESVDVAVNLGIDAKKSDQTVRGSVVLPAGTGKKVRVAVFAQGIPGGIHALDTGRLVVVPGDRHEVIMAAYLTELSGTHLAGLLLSTGTAPDPRISELTRATAAAGLPVLLVDDDSYQTAMRVRDLDPGLPVDDLERIEQVTDNVADALDPSWLESLTGVSRSRRLSPAAFRYQLAELARAADALIVLPEGTEPRTVRAAVACAERGIAHCLLLGSQARWPPPGPRSSA